MPQHERKPRTGGPAPPEPRSELIRDLKMRGTSQGGHGFSESRMPSVGKITLIVLVAIVLLFLALDCADSMFGSDDRLPIVCGRACSFLPDWEGVRGWEIATLAARFSPPDWGS